MRSPSARALKNRCDIFVAGPGRDAEGGVMFPYPSLPTYPSVPCSIQGKATEVMEAQSNRITQLTVFHVVFGRALKVSPRDKLQFIDANGVQRTVFIESIEDMAGREAAFGVFAQERL